MPYALALNRLRVGEQTADDLALFKTFEIDSSSPPSTYSIFIRHIFSTHKILNQHNDLVLERLPSAVVDVEAQDSVVASHIVEKDKCFFLNKAKRMPSDKTSTLCSVLHLKIGMILEVTLNLDIPDGLYNGAWGTLKAIDILQPPELLWIEFASAKVGKFIRRTYSKTYNERTELCRSWTPVSKISRTFQATSREESAVLRWQFPVKPATAGTFHHNQGLSLQRGAVNFRGPKRFAKLAGRHYVGYSRFGQPDNNMFVLDSAFEEIHTDRRVHAEMRRLRECTKTPLSIFELPATSEFPNELFFVMHNARSLHARIDDVRADDNFTRADILIFTEARVQKQLLTSSHYQIPGFQFDECSSSHDRSTKSNLLIYYKFHDQQFKIISHYALNHPQISIAYYSMCLPLINSHQLHFIALYRSPVRECLDFFFEQLNAALQHFETIRFSSASPLIVVGDFNIDMLKSTLESRRLDSLFVKFNCRQIIDRQTSNYGSLIDHVWTNIMSLNIEYLESFWSDHIPVCIRWSP